MINLRLAAGDYSTMRYCLHLAYLLLAEVSTLDRCFLTCQATSPHMSLVASLTLAKCSLTWPHTSHLLNELLQTGFHWPIYSPLFSITFCRRCHRKVFPDLSSLFSYLSLAAGGTSALCFLTCLVPPLTCHLLQEIPQPCVSWPV